MTNPWKEYKKGVNYLKKNGIMVYIKMPLGGKTEFVGSLIMLENLHGSKDLLPNNHYTEAATIVVYMFKLWYK